MTDTMLAHGPTIWVVSDIHLRLSDARALLLPFDIPEADVCVIAGDICESMSVSLHWIRNRIVPHMPVVFVPGNHEFYDTSISIGRKDARFLCRSMGVHLLDDGEAVVEGVRFLGGTLWSDYEILAGNGPDKIAETRRSMAHAARTLNDHRYIDNTGVDGSGTIPKLFHPTDAVKLFRTTRAFIAERLAEPFDGSTCVVTHHAPHRRSIAPKFADDIQTGAFVSDLEDLILEGAPDMWIHGHVHTAFDYEVGRTRVVCNPRGYSRELAAGHGSSGSFDPSKVVRIGRQHRVRTAP